MSPNTRTRRWLGGPLHPLRPDTPQTHPMPWPLNHTPFQALWSIRYYSQFPEVIPEHRAGYPRVTEQFAKNLISFYSHGLIELQKRSPLAGSTRFLLFWSLGYLSHDLLLSLKKLARKYCTWALAQKYIIISITFLTLNHDGFSRSQYLRHCVKRG